MSMAAALLLLVVAQTPTATEHFVAALQDPRRIVRDAAVASAAGATTPDLPALTALLSHADQRVVAGAGVVLEARDDTAALPVLAARAADADPDRGAVATRALVLLALRHRRPLAAYADTVPRVRIAAAFDYWAMVHWRHLRGAPSLDRPQQYRFLLPGGEHAERWLLARFTDRRRTAFDRAHAVHAYTRLVGARASPVLDSLLDDPAPGVRAAASALIVRYRSAPGLARLAERLEGDRILGAAERSQATAAAAAMKVLGPRARTALRRTILHRTLGEALYAARTLKAIAPDEARKAIRARVAAILTRRRVGAGSGVAAVLFEIGVGPLEDEQRAILAAASEPLLRAAVAGPKESLARLRPLLAPRQFAGAIEMIRVEAISRLLRRHDAPADMRCAFAAAALRRPGTVMRRHALAVLAGQPRAALASLDDILDATLEHGSESVRVAAALLRGPTEKTRAVLLNALYDGDPRYGARAARGLAAAWPDAPRIDPDAPVADRRAEGLRWKPRVLAAPRDKD